MKGVLRGRDERCGQTAAPHTLQVQKQATTGEAPGLFSATLTREETGLVFRDLMIPRKNDVPLRRVSFCRAKLYMDLCKFSS